MTNIAVLTDTDASLPLAYATEKLVALVPILIQFGAESIESDFQIDDARLFARIDAEGKLPTTAAPSPGQWAQAFEEAFEWGAEAVLCFCVSSVMSGTYNAACVARDSLPGRDITVVDTLQISAPQGFMAVAAAEALANGATRDEALALAQDVASRSHLYGALATLRYLAMSGRVGHIAAGMAGLLNIKPILTIRDGKLDMLEKVRTRSRAWERIVTLLQNDLQGRAPERMSVVHVAAPAGADEFVALLRRSLPCPEEILVAPLSPGLSVHTGAGMVGVAVVATK
jgi:DegV family protein with EDD domain